MILCITLGSPPTTDVDITSLHAKNPKDLWKKVYERVFPQEVVQSLASDISENQHPQTEQSYPHTY